MLRGLTVSALVHASVLAMAVISWPQKKDDCQEQIDRLRRQQPGISSVEILMQLPQCASSADLPIDFVEIGRISNVADLRKSDTPEPDPEPAAPEPEPEVPPPPPEPEPTPQAPEPEVEVPDPRKPEPEPEPKKPEPKKEEPKKEEPKPKPPVQKPPEKPKDDLSFLDDFESALQSRKTQERRPETQQTDRPVLSNADRDQQGAGARTGATASLQAALRRQIGECWPTVDDLPPEHQIDVVVGVQLARDGSLISSKLISPGSRPVGRSGIAVDRALLAVRKCGETTYRLPAEDYELWKDINVTLGPRRG